MINIQDGVARTTKTLILDEFDKSLENINDIEKIKKLGIPIIEDCAHSFGADINNNKIKY